MDIREPAIRPKAVSRWRTTKVAATSTMGAASVGVAVAQTATGQTTLALATGAAAASATGIGLVVAAGALTIGTSALAARSAYKTKAHRDNLMAIYERRHSYSCTCVCEGDEINLFQHKVIAEDVLPYIISKKGSKYHRKIAVASVAFSGVEAARSMGKSIYKRIRGTRGRNRRKAAIWLGDHLITHNCGLAQAIVADLYSYEEMLWMQTLDLKDLIPLLMNKMRSV